MMRRGVVEMAYALGFATGNNDAKVSEKVTEL